MIIVRHVCAAADAVLFLCMFFIKKQSVFGIIQVYGCRYVYGLNNDPDHLCEGSMYIPVLKKYCKGYGVNRK